MTATESKWAERVGEWKASGKTAKEFAEGQEFKASTLVYWASCLRRGRTGTSRPRKREADVRMVRVVARPAQREEAILVEIGGSRVAVRRGFNEALLQQVIKALGSER